MVITRGRMRGASTTRRETSAPHDLDEADEGRQEIGRGMPICSGNHTEQARIGN
jgi:hypothetical protein